MEFDAKVKLLTEKIMQHGDSIETEEATKNAFVMPFLSQILGYDVFNPAEVVPEFTADVGVKKGEKVDYALLLDGQVQMLIECKPFKEKLSLKHASQLYRYFSVVDTRIAVLTNGSEYQFYTDLDSKNKMDEKPFLVFDFSSIDKHLLPELKKLVKSNFDVDSVLSAAEELKYLGQIKNVLVEQLEDPDDDLVRFFGAKIYEGVVTAKFKQTLKPLVAKAMAQYVNDKISDRLQTAIGNVAESDKVESIIDDDQTQVEVDESGIVTTQEELDGFNIVRAILRQDVDVKRIGHRDTRSYFGILLDNTIRKQVCRLHFNAKQKYIGLFDENKKETRHPIDDLDDLFNFKEQLVERVKSYD